MPSFRNLRPDAVLFDLDGVLVASEPLHWKAWGMLLSELGLPPSEAELKAMVGKTAPEIMAHLLDQYRPGWGPGKFDVHALARKKNDFYLKLANSALEPYPGVPELLRWLKFEGIRTAVVSNAKGRELEAALSKLGLIDSFDRLVPRDDIRPPKPDPAPYLTAAALLGVELDACLAVEDSPTGIESSLRAGIPSAAVLTNFPRTALEKPVPGRPDLEPTWIGAGIRELHAWLQSLKPSPEVASAR